MKVARLAARFAWPLLLFGVSCSPTTRPGGELPSYNLVDHFGAWTPDGDSVLYQRLVPSADGPAGLYLTGSRGGTPRYIATVGWWEPECSPVARRACGSRGGQIVLVDFDSGVVTQVTHSHNGALSPSWNPTGDSIVYSRNLQDPGESRDSVGLFIVDLASATDTPIKHAGVTPLGSSLAWAPRGGLIAFSGMNGIYLTDAKGTRLDRLTIAPNGSIHDHPMWIQNGSALLFEEYGHSAPRTFRVDVDGDNLHQWPYYVPPTAAISPADSVVVFPGIQPESDYVVLFRRNVPDKFGYTVRPLTVYRPDSAYPLAVDSFRNEFPK